MKIFKHCPRLFVPVLLAFAALLVFLPAGAATSSLTTTFAGGTSAQTSAAGDAVGAFFDVTANKTVTITSFDLHLDGDNNVRIYYKPGTYAGFRTNGGAWTLLGTQVILGATPGGPTPVSIGGVTIPAGQTYGFYVAGVHPSRTFFTSGSNSYNSSELRINTGIFMVSSSGGGLFDNGVTYTSATWNGTIHYQSDDTSVGGVMAPPDHRINWMHGDTHAVIYPATDAAGAPALQAYCVNENGEGYHTLTITEANLAPYPAQPEQNAEVARSDDCNVAFHILTTGEYQFTIGPNGDGAIRAVIFDDLAGSGVYFRDRDVR